MTFSTKSISFNGVDGYVDVGRAPMFIKERTDAFSVSCWAKTKATASINTLVGKMDSSSGTGYLMFLNASGQFEAVLRNTPATDSLRVRTVADGYNEGGYHHLAMTYDGLGGLLLYVDGLVKATTTVYDNLASSIINTAPFQIGAYDGGDPFEGNIDDVAFYDYKLTSSEILGLFGSAQPTDLSLIYTPLTESAEFYPANFGLDRNIDFGEFPQTEFEAADAFTLGVWFRGTPQPATPVTGALMSRTRWWPNYNGWLLMRNSDDRVWFRLGVTDSNYIQTTTDNPIPLGEWIFVLATYDGSGSSAGMTIYFNGVAIPQTKTDAGIMSAINWTSTGMYVGSTDNYLLSVAGRLCHSFVTNRVTTPAEVAQISSLGRPAKIDQFYSAPEIVHWCTVGNGCTTGAGNCPDLSPLGNNGTSGNHTAAELDVDDVPPTQTQGYLPLTTSVLEDGVDGSVNFPISKNWVISDPMTVLVWCKTGVGTGGGYLVTDIDFATKKGWRFSSGSGSSVYFSDANGWAHPGSDYFHSGGGVDIRDGNWHLVGFKYSGSGAASGITHLIDGVEYGGSTSGFALGDITNTAGLRIGSVTGDNTSTWDGNVCHSAVWDRELDKYDIYMLYGDGATPKDLSAVSDGLIHWSRLGDGDAVGAGGMIDLSLGNDGTLLGGGSFVSDTPTPGTSPVVPILPRSPVGWWRLGDNDTYPTLTDRTASDYAFPIVRDMSGNNRDGTATNMELDDVVRDIPRSDFCKYSTYFDGVSDYYSMGDVLDFDRFDTQSWSFWFKTTVGGGWMITKQNFGNPEGWSINWESSSTIGIRLTKVWPTDMVRIETSVGSLNDGEWHHAVVTWSGATGLAADCRIYIDGIEDTSLVIVTNTLSGTILNASTNDFRIAGRQAGDAPYQGQLAEIAIYYSVLSLAEVQWIYNSGLPRALDGYGAPSNLVAWWRLGTIEQVDEQTRDLVWGSSADTAQVNDMSRFTNHATPTNTEVGDFASDTPGGDSKFSVDLNDHLYSHESIEFAGASEYITMGDILNFEYNDAFSMSIWARWTAASDMVFVGKRDATDKGYWLAVTSTGKINAGAMNTPVTAGANVVTTSTGWNDGGWHHIVMTKGTSSAASSWKIYVDGSLEALDAPIWDTLGTNSIVSTGPFTVSSSNGDNYFFTGRIDEVAVYDKELSLGEITAIYNSGDPTDLSLLLTAQNIAGWWRLGDGDVYPTAYGQVDSPFAYPTVPDMSVNDNNGTMVNMEVGDSVPEFHRSAFTKYSVDFDGTAEYVTMGDVFGFEYTQDFSISAWLKTSTVATGYLVAKREGAGNYKGYGLSMLASGKLELSICNIIGTFEARVETNATYNDGDWHHVVATWDGNASPGAAGISLYVDGNLAPSTITNNTALATIINTADFNIGSRTNGGAPFDGKIADVAIYDAELSVADVTWIYNGGTPLDLRDGYDDGGGNNNLFLSAYWRPGNGRDELGYIKKIQDWVWGDSGTKETTTITDASFLKNDLTLNNMVAADVVSDTPGGISNYSCRFDGVDNFAFTSLNKTHYAIENGDVLSLSGWVKTTSSGDPEYLWGNAYSGTGKAGYHVSLSSGKPTFGMIANDLSATKFIIQTTSATVNDGYWHHVVFTEYNVGTNNYNVVCYIDGVSVGLTTLNNALGSTSISTGEGFSVGGRGSTGDDPLDGYIDEVSVYTKTLTQSDVTAIYNGGSPVDLRMLSANLHMKGWWRMGDSYGIIGTAVNTEALDKVGDAPGAIVFTTRSLQFNPANEYVNLGNPSELNFDVSDPFSISAWVKQSQQASYQGIVGKSTGGVGWYLTVYNDNITATAKSNLQFVLDGTGLIEVYMGDRRGAFPYNEWVHVVVTYDGSNSGAGVKFYMNGELYVTQVRYDIANATILNSANVLINYANGQDGIGNLDEVSIWDKELTQADVTGIWNSGDANDLDLHPSTFNLVGWWRLGDGYGPVSGTMTNMSADDINGDIPVASPEYLISASGTTQTDFGATSGPKWTAAAWVKTTASFGVIINKNYSTDFSGWGMRLRSGYPTLWWASNPASLITEQRSDTQINDGYWHHVVALREKAPADGTPICKFYVDGVLTGTTTVVDTNVNNTINNSGTVSIGFAKGSGEGEQPFIGKIAEVAVWQRHLTYAQILDAYNGGSPPNLISLDSESALVGWWKCGDDSGYPGTPVSILTSAKKGDTPEEEFTTTSFGMDGSDEYVDAGNVLGFERTDAFSLSIWFRTTGTPGNFALLTKRNNSGNVGYALQITTDAELHVILRNTFSTNEAKVTTNAGVPYNDGQWHHAVMCYDGSSSTSGITIYVDGVSRSYVVDADTLSASILTTTSFRIGAKESADYFPGTLDEASVWGKELSQSEVTELYNGGTPADLAEHSATVNLDGWWRMGEEVANDGAMVNMIPSDIIANAPKEPGAVGEQIDYFLMRGIDTACGTLTYHHWLVTEFPDFTGAQAGTLPCGGPLTDIVIASSWSVIN